MQQTKLESVIGGRTFSIEAGLFAQQADGAVTARYGDTVVLATAVMSEKVREGIDYFPLLVDFEERLYAAGKIKGSRFIKREGRPTDEAIISGRLIDRCLRPLFPEGMRNDVQVMITTLSHDQENDPDIIAINAASTALCISRIPFGGPVAAVRIGHVDGNFVVNPTYEQRLKGDLDLVIAATKKSILMIEAEANQVPEELALEAVKLGQKELPALFRLQEGIAAKKASPKTEPIFFKVPDEIIREVQNQAGEKLKEALFDGKTKEERVERLKILKASLLEKITVSLGAEEKANRVLQLGFAFEKIINKAIRSRILAEDIRIDGRKPDELRPISCSVGVLPRTHGSAVFQRGETQVLSIATLGAPGDEQILDTLEENDTKKRYMHHYNMPGFSTGEVRPSRGPGRREIGHGALAERAIERMLPSKDEFPYTIRVVSEVLSSNGSTSMASTCGSMLALMDAGVPVKAIIAGISIGLITAEDNEAEYRLLTDIQGLEDAYGDMDFKVAGSETGITAIQLDVKLEGLPEGVVEKTLEAAKKARMEILKIMTQTLPAPRKDLSPFAPRILSFRINPEKIGEVIGPGGKTINAIIADTGVEIDIEDDGLVMITSHNAEAAKKAEEWIRNIVREVQAGETFEGKVTRIMPFGAFVEILPGQEGLVHISELAPYRVEKVEDVVKVGDVIPVMVTEIDHMGRINLSHRVMNHSPVREGEQDRAGHEMRHHPRRASGSGGVRRDRRR